MVIETDRVFWILRIRIVPSTKSEPILYNAAVKAGMSMAGLSMGLTVSVIVVESLIPSASFSMMVDACAEAVFVGMPAMARFGDVVEVLS